MSKITNQRNQDEVILSLLRTSWPSSVGGLTLARASGSRSLPARISALRAVGWDIIATSDENCPEGMSQYRLVSVNKGKPLGRVQVFVDLPEHPCSHEGAYWTVTDAKMIQEKLQVLVSSIVDSFDFHPARSEDEINLFD